MGLKFKKSSGSSEKPDKDKKKDKKNSSKRNKEDKKKSRKGTTSDSSTPISAPQGTATDASHTSHQQLSTSPEKEKIPHAFSTGMESATDTDPHLVTEGDDDDQVVVQLAVICRAEAVCAYSPDTTDEVDEDITFLRFLKGDIINVVEQDESGWWEGILDGEWGIFPGSYVKVIEIYEVEEPHDDAPYEEPGALEDTVLEEDSDSVATTKSLDDEGKEMDDVLSNLISQYGTKDIPAPAPPSEDEEATADEILDEMEALMNEESGGHDFPPPKEDDEEEEEEEFDRDAFLQEAPAPVLSPRFVGAANLGVVDDAEEIIELRQLCEDKDAEIESLLKQHEEAHQEINTLERKLNVSEGAKNALEEQVTQLEKKLQRAEEQMIIIQDNLQKEVNSRTQYEQVKLQLTNELDGLRTQHKTLLVQNQTTEAELKNVREQLKSSLENNSEEQIQSLQSQVNSLQQSLDQKTEAIQEKEDRLTEVKTINSSLVLRVQQLETQVEESSRKQDDVVKTLEEQIRDLTEKNQALKTELKAKTETEIEQANAIRKLKTETTTTTRRGSFTSAGPPPFAPAASKESPAEVRKSPTPGSSLKKTEESAPAEKSPAPAAKTPEVTVEEPIQQPSPAGEGGSAPREGTPAVRARGRGRVLRGQRGGRGAPVRGGAPAPRGTAPVRGNAPARGTGAVTARGSVPVGVVRGARPLSTGTRGGQFRKPTGPQGRPVTRKLVRTALPSVPPPVPVPEQDLESEKEQDDDSQENPEADD